MDSATAALIEPDWTLVFCKKPGRWWVRLLACGRYNHVKAIAYLPSVRAWLFYDVKFNGTKILLADEDDPRTDDFLRDYLDNCDTIAMPRLPIPKRSAPQLGFWCTIAMKHLIGIRSRAFRPDRLWRDCIAVGGKPHGSLGVCRGALIKALCTRMRALQARTRARRRLLGACPA
jgi:hypothetical protein